MADSRRPGWTLWQSCLMPDREIERIWREARPLHFLKENRTVYYDGSELVGEIQWRVLAHLCRMKKPPADRKPREIDYDRVLATMAAWHAARGSA
ncbi:MAG: hypothetical protein E5Y10_27000 [Mesorhizobium sp.]|nr:MAG: hypothetical protein E5Y10_27000 [Mesorhizobium sp.]